MRTHHEIVAAGRTCRPGIPAALLAFGLVEPDASRTVFYTHDEDEKVLHIKPECAQGWARGRVSVTEETATYQAIADASDDVCTNCNTLSALAPHATAVNGLASWARDRWGTGIHDPAPNWRHEPGQAVDLLIESGFQIAELPSLGDTGALTLAAIIAADRHTLLSFDQVRHARAARALHWWNQGLHERSFGNGYGDFSDYEDRVSDTAEQMTALTKDATGTNIGTLMAWYEHVTEPTVWVNMLDLSSDQLLVADTPGPDNLDTRLCKMPTAALWGPSAPPRIYAIDSQVPDESVHAAARLAGENSVDSDFDRRLPELVEALTAARL